MSFTFIDKLGNFVNPIISLFFMSIIATIWFNLINYKNLKSIYTNFLRNKRIFLMLSSMVGLNWLCSIFAPHKSDPFIYLSATFIVMAICGLVFKPKKSKIHFYIEWISIILLISCMLLLRYNYAIHHTKDIDIGLILGTSAGITSYYYAVFSEKYSRLNSFSSSQILALRFWPLIIVLGCHIFIRHIPISFTWNMFSVLLLMSFLTLIIPVFFLQQAIIRMKTNNLSFMLAMTPVITFIIYTVSIWKLNWTNFVICLLITLTLI
ncbi:MAG: hypothetical protein K0R49_1778, partial [Burkholderiales bacterium]|nr:hypothetical protein [Burkholderiales bacterium]